MKGNQKTSKRSKDFMLTIDDEDQVADLDTEKGIDLNPDFQFGEEEATDFTEGWNFGADVNDNPNTLDEIIKRHGGLQEDEVKEEVKSESESESEAESEDESESKSEDEDEAEEKDEEKGEGEDEEKTEADQKTVANDKSGFFEDAKVDMTAHKSFAHLSLSRPIQKGISGLGYVSPTPIQSSVIPVALLGKDIVAGAVTGSGKTAAYMIPTLERLVYRPLKTPATRVIVLTPTRELAIQVLDVSKKLGSHISNLRFGMAVGGLNLRAQEQELKTRPDVVVATPGRFIDHIRNSPSFSVDQVEILVVDEADRMLEEGFEAEVSEILSLIPSKRQTMLFSATMNSSIKSLIKLSLHKPVRLMINPPKQAAANLVQEFVRIRKHEDSRPAILASLLRKLDRNQRVIVFVGRKQTAHRLRVILGLLNLRVGELHGALTQEQRLESVTNFKDLKVPILLCTDLASRGLDIPKIEAVINYELPSTYEVYLHRVGRTARAGRSGVAISMVGESTQERQVVRSAISSANENTKAQKQKILGRNIDWTEIASIKEEIASKQETVDEVLQEEKIAKEISYAERDVKKVENLMKHQDEIKSRPKRTWFEENATKKQKTAKTNHQKKIADAGADSNWSYRKTKADRNVSTKRGAQRAITKVGAKKAKKLTSSKK